MANHPNRKKSDDSVTAEMMRAAQYAEFRHYYPRGNYADYDWKGTSRTIIRKMLAAAMKHNQMERASEPEPISAGN